MDECWHYDCTNCPIACTCVSCHGQACYDASKPGYNPWEESLKDWHYKDKTLRMYCEDCIDVGNAMMAEEFDTLAFARAAVVLQRAWRRVLAAKKLQTVCEWLDAVEPGYGEKYGDIFGEFGFTAGEDMEVFYYGGCHSLLKAICKEGIEEEAVAKIKTALCLIGYD